MNQVDKGVDGLTIGHEVIDHENAVSGVQIGLGDKHLVGLFVGKGVGLRYIFVVSTVGSLTLLGKDHRHVV